MIQARYQKRLIVGAILLAIALAIGGAVWFFSFRVTSVSPQKKVSSTITQIQFTFNRDLSETTLAGIQIFPATNGAYLIEKNSLIFKPTDDLKEGPLVFRLTNITAKDGSLIKSYNKTFSVEYVPYNDLSKDEKKRQVDESGGGQQQFDLLNGFLPRAEYNYTLDYIEPLLTDKKLTLVIDVYGKAPDETVETFQARMELAKKDMLRYVETNKGKNSLGDFIFLYNNDYLSRYNTIPSDVTPGG